MTVSSVAIRKVQDTGVETLTLFADTLGEIKEIRGFIYYPQQETPQPLLADRISLMRYHATDSLVIDPKGQPSAGDRLPSQRQYRKT